MSSLPTAEPRAGADNRSLERQVALLRTQNQSVAAVVELIARVQAQADLRLGCRVLVEDLRRHLACAEVVVGLCDERGNDCKMQARAAGEDHEDSAFTQTAEAVLREAVIRGEPAIWPPQDDRQRHSLLAHQHFARTQQLGALASWPLRTDNGVAVGALLVGWEQREPAWTAPQRQFMQALQPPLGAALRLLSRARLSRLEQGLRAFRSWIGSRRAVLAAVAATAVLALLWAPFPYKISCQCQLEPVLRRFVAAPFDGQLLAALAEPGDVVQLGQPLAELDGREIRWELTATRADLHRVEKERAGSLSTHEVGKAQIAEHEAERLRIKIKLLEHRLEELDVRSPLAGVVVDGDLERAQGMPVEQGQVLFEIAPLDRMIVEVAIPESEVAFVREGMPVRIALDAFPQRRWKATLQRVHPRSELRDNENVFIAQVPLEDAEGLRPGMRGSASIAAGSHPLGWNLFHRAWASLLIWLGV